MLKKLFKNLRNSEGGVVIEFAFILPIFLIMTFPLIDYGRYILLQQKCIKASHMIADAIGLSREVEASTTQTDIDQDGSYLTQNALVAVTTQLDNLMTPFPPDGTGGIERYQAVITHVYEDSGNARVGWQFDQNSQAFSSAASSNISSGVRGSAATLPASLASTLTANENLIAVEVSVLFQPITPDLQVLGVPFLTETRIEHDAYFPARYGNLGCIWQVYMPPNDC